MTETNHKFCRNCGNELKPNAIACLSCGVPPTKGNQHCPSCAASTNPEAIICVKCGESLLHETASVENPISIKKYKSLPYANFPIILICFMFTFAFVKCGNNNMKLMEFSGYQLVTGIELNHPDFSNQDKFSPFETQETLRRQLMDESSPSDNTINKIPPQEELIACILIALIGILLFFFDRSRNYLSPLILSSLGVLLLFIWKMRIDERMTSNSSIISLGYGIGYWLSLLVFGVGALIHFYFLKTFIGKEELRGNISKFLKAIKIIVPLILVVFTVWWYFIRDNPYHDGEKAATLEMEFDEIYNNERLLLIKPILTKLEQGQYQSENEVTNDMNEAVSSIYKKYKDSDYLNYFGRKKKVYENDEQNLKILKDTWRKKLNESSASQNEELNDVLKKIEQKKSELSNRNNQSYLSQGSADAIAASEGDRQAIVQKRNSDDNQNFKNKFVVILNNYYNQLSGRNLNPNYYFAENITQYYTKYNITPQDISSELKSYYKEFSDASFEILPNTIVVVEDISRITYTGEFRCYRNSLKKYQSCYVTAQVEFNQNDKIVSMKEIKVENLKFSESK